MPNSRRQFLKGAGLAAASTTLVAQANAQTSVTSTAAVSAGVNASQALPKGLTYATIERNGRLSLGLRTAGGDRKSTRLNSSHVSESRMPSSA